jgi:hypothetical protein
MAPSPPPSPPTSAGMSPSHEPSAVATPSSLNPQASSFSPSFHHGVVAEELPEWLLLNPSSSEGWSGRLSNASLVPSFVDVVRRKSPADPAGASSSVVALEGWNGHHEGKAWGALAGQSAGGPSGVLPNQAEWIYGGCSPRGWPWRPSTFIVWEACAASVLALTPPPPTPREWQVISRRKN